MTTRFEELQNEHQVLLERVQHEAAQPGTPAGAPAGKPSAELLAAVLAYIEAAKAGARQVPGMRDRNQLRAILRYWGSWVYEQSGVFPDTTLQPPEMAAAAEPEPGDSKPVKRNPVLIIGVVGGGLLLLALIFMAAMASLRRPMATPPPASTSVSGLDSPTIPVDMAFPSETIEPTAASGSASKPPTPALVTATPTAILPPATAVAAASATAAATAAAPTRIVIPMMRTMAAATRVASQPTATLAVLPPAGGGPPVFPTQLPATGGGGFFIVEPDYLMAPGCDSRSLTLATRGESSSPQSVAEIQIFEAGGSQALNAGSLPLDGTSQMTFDLPDPQQSKTYLVKVGQVNETALFEASLVPFPADCSRNHITLTYDISGLSGESASAAPSALALDWQVINWGPLSGMGQWTATISISAPGAGQNATYWNLSGDQPVLLPDQKLIVTANDCAPADINIGVTAAGETASESIHLLLWSPECSGQ